MNTAHPAPAGRAAALPRNLETQQRWLFERVTDPLEHEPIGRAAAASKGFVTDDTYWVRAGAVPAARRIDVYRHGYIERLIECLADDYRALAHALGPVDFRALCLDFIEAHPPQSASLNFYGAPFASFCAAWPAPFAPCASELARLEWALVEAIHADASSALEPAHLGAIAADDWARAHLVPSPALRLLRLAYPVHRHYRAFLAGEDPSLPAFEPSVVAVSRRGDDVWRVAIAPPFVPFLNQLVAGRPLASALDAVNPNELGANGLAELQRVSSEWVACGFFAALAF